MSFRLAPKQDPDKIVAAFREFAEKHTPKGIHFQVRILSSGPGLSVNPDLPAIKVAAEAFSDILGKKTVFIRSGGSIPIVGCLDNYYKPGNADDAAWNRVAGTEVEGGAGGQGRALSRELGVPTESQFRWVSYPETQRARMTRREFLTTTEWRRRERSRWL